MKSRQKRWHPPTKWQCICKVDENCKWMKVVLMLVFVRFSNWICCWSHHFISSDDETVAITWFVFCHLLNDYLVRLLWMFAISYHDILRKHWGTAKEKIHTQVTTRICSFIPLTKENCNSRTEWMAKGLRIKMNKSLTVCWRQSKALILDFCQRLNR